MKSRSNIFLAIVIVLTGLSIWGYRSLKYNLGIDVQGGVRLVYTVSQVQDKNSERSTTLEQDRLATIRVLQRRASGIGALEGSVFAKGADQIVVELPGFTDIEQAKSIMGSTSRLYAYDALNVTTKARTRTYAVGPTKQVNGIPVVTFQRQIGDKQEIDPDNPEYAKIIAQWGTPLLQGADLIDAKPQTLSAGKVIPTFRFSSSAAGRMEQWSRRVLNQGEFLAFVIDGKVLSIAPLKDGAIISDNAIIEGEFDPKAVVQLCTLLREGALEVNLKRESEQKIDASIGTGALNQIVIAGAGSFALICAFLIFYYSLPGLIAAVAMTLYTLFTITALKAIGATFSLAAIAAFILSVGMAVDANILVFERTKEELRAGRELLNAVDLGFKRALSAIFDSNACTIITSLVLYTLGTGPVKGFALTLIFGVGISFFTAFTVTRAFLMTAVKSGFLNNPKYFAVKRNWFGERMEEGAHSKQIEVLGRYKTWFTISAVLIVIGAGFVAAGGIKPNVEFGGGYEATFRVGSDVSRSGLTDTLKKNGIADANVQLGSGIDPKTGKEIRFAYITVQNIPGIDPNNTEAAKAKLAEAAGGLSTTDASFQYVGPKIQKEMVSNAILGVVISSCLIILYITSRFGVALGGMKNGIKFGLSAIAALLHDTLFVIGSAGIFGMLMGWEISALFITAMLTVIGFSVHDTIIIFDRIRENLRRPHKGETFEHLVDKSVTQTVARSINTSMTAFAPLMILVFFGTTVPEIKFMCLTMAAGIAVGTYSSIFNASPILWLWNKAVIKKHGEQADLMIEAQREAKLRAKLAAAPSDRVYRDEGTGSTYGQVKTRKSVREQASKEIDFEDL